MDKTTVIDHYTKIIEHCKIRLSGMEIPKFLIPFGSWQVEDIVHLQEVCDEKNWQIASSIDVMKKYAKIMDEKFKIVTEEFAKAGMEFQVSFNMRYAEDWSSPTLYGEHETVMLYSEIWYEEIRTKLFYPMLGINNIYPLVAAIKFLYVSDQKWAEENLTHLGINDDS